MNPCANNLSSTSSKALTIDTKDMVARFMHYVTIDTRSDDHTLGTPSTAVQWVLANQLAKELTELGLVDVVVTESCFVHATLPANVEQALCGDVSSCVNSSPAIGLMAHLDTYPGFSGTSVKPILHPRYAGGEIVIQEAPRLVISPELSPELKNYIGHDIITSDGTTLLGADDKAGIAEIMAAVAYLVKHPEVPHGEIRIAFTPDEEIDRGGLSALEAANFPVDLVLTVDGDGLGEINFDNFNAAHVDLIFTGRSVHTGEAKGRMRHATKMALEWLSHLPEQEVAENTEGYEGFYHLDALEGGVDTAALTVLIRDFDAEGYQKRLKALSDITRTLQEKYGSENIAMTLTEDYRNMQAVIEKKPYLKTALIAAVKAAGITPKVTPIRGGTDGALLAEMGIPAPNLFIGGHNYHGQYEFVSVQAMEAAARAVVHFVVLLSQGGFDD